MKSIALVFISSVSLFASAHNGFDNPPSHWFLLEPLINQQNYISGKQWCEKFKDVTAKENGQYTPVPLNYENPDGPTTAVYSWFTGGEYDPSLPTYFFITGGPGGNTHRFTQKWISGWNELNIDFRGIGCSHHADFETYADPSQVSTLALVRDIEKVRQTWNIPKVSLFGVSAGTEISTVYASLYPEYTAAVVQEATMYAPRGKLHIQHWGDRAAAVYAALTPELQSAADDFFVGDKSIWFYEICFSFFYDEFGVQKTVNFFNQIYVNGKMSENLILAAGLHNLFFSPLPIPIDESIDALENRFWHVSMCKEIEGPDMIELFRLSLDHKQFNYSWPYTAEAQAHCASLGVTTPDFYQAQNYPVQVPITYFQGGSEIITPAEFAHEHYLNVAQGKAQFILRKEGAHNTLLHLFFSKSPEENQIASRMLDSGLRGQDILDADLIALGQLTQDTWTIERK